MFFSGASMMSKRGWPRYDGQSVLFEDKDASSLFWNPSKLG
jgi:hypothetical protein